MFLTVYKKLSNSELYLIRFELVNNKYRRWRGKEGSIMLCGKWYEFEGMPYQTGKARAALYMFKAMNTLIEKGYSVYKKRSKKIKVIKPIIRIRKLTLITIKKIYDEGHILYYTFYYGSLAVRRTNGFVYNNQTKRKIAEVAFKETNKPLLGYYHKQTGFVPFPWDVTGSPKELELWLKHALTKHLKSIARINECYYAD